MLCSKTCLAINLHRLICLKAYLYIYPTGIPRGRAGEPEDAVGAAIFLASRASAWITEAILPVDGGMVAKAW